MPLLQLDSYLAGLSSNQSVDLTESCHVGPALPHRGVVSTETGRNSMDIALKSLEERQYINLSYLMIRKPVVP